MHDLTELEQAEQQLTGFYSAFRGCTISVLVAEMGLQRDEWITLKATGRVRWLPEKLGKEIDKYFEDK